MKYNKDSLMGLRHICPKGFVLYDCDLQPLNMRMSCEIL